MRYPPEFLVAGLHTLTKLSPRLGYWPVFRQGPGALFAQLRAVFLQARENDHVAIVHFGSAIFGNVARAPGIAFLRRGRADASDLPVLTATVGTNYS